MPQNVFVGEVARYYDANSAPQYEPAVLDPTVEFLAGLTGRGKALEFAIGTGRVALALRARGTEVHGIEISQDMVTELRAKPGGEHVPVVIGDMTSTRLDESFALVYLAFNTISNLLTQAEQVACFRNAAAHLEPGGCFVVELGIPQLRRIPPGESAHPFEISDEHLGFDTYDFAEQRMTSHHYWLEGNRVHRFDSHHRYIWPAELDLMAELAGMHPQERWADWSRAPFTGESPNHVSVWKKS
ncbi:MAG: class I SAM-dependent DNA methyltransferase [Acidimicrobiia bacterium]